MNKTSLLVFLTSICITMESFSAVNDCSIKGDSYLDSIYDSNLSFTLDTNGCNVDVLDYRE